MLNYYEYQRKLNQMTFDNFILDKSNEQAYAKFFEMSQDNNHSGKRIIVIGPSKIGKSHLTISLLDKLSHQNPNLKIKRMHGTEFSARVIADAANKNYDSWLVDEELIYELLQNDVLVIHNLNEISEQLSVDGRNKNTLCHLLDRWDAANKTLIFTFSELPEWKIKNEEILARLKNFEWLKIKTYDKAAIKKWLERAISLVQIEVDMNTKASILNKSMDIVHCRYLLQKYFFEHKSDHFVMTRPTPSVEQILDFVIGKQNGYTRIFDYTKINNSERTRKYAVYFLDKYTDMCPKEIAKTLGINQNVVCKDLRQHSTYLDDKEKELLELYNKVLLSRWDDCYHTENNYEWI